MISPQSCRWENRSGEFSGLGPRYQEAFIWNAPGTTSLSIQRMRVAHLLYSGALAATRAGGLSSVTMCLPYLVLSAMKNPFREVAGGTGVTNRILGWRRMPQVSGEEGPGEEQPGEGERRDGRQG